MDDENSEQKIPKPYTLTTKGIEYVERYTPKDFTEKKNSKGKKPRPKRESIYCNINPDELNLSNYCEIKELKSFKEKMMVVMYIITNEQI